MRYEIHRSWSLAVAGACFVLGVALSQWAPIPFWVGVACLIAMPVLVYMSRRGLLPFIGCLGIGVGVGYGSLHVISRSTYGGVMNTTGVVQGRVKEDISKTASGSHSIQLDEVIIQNVSFPGTILVSARNTGGALRGDYITFEGTMRAGFGSFPASATIRTLITVERKGAGDVGRAVRDWFADKVRKEIPDPQASLGIGFLTGQKSALPSDLADALKIAGLSHIVVASGYNLTILVRMARKLLLRLSKYLSAVCSGVMILLFVAVTGMSPSMTRAGLVSSMSLLSWYYGHGFHPLVLLPVAAAITVAFQPSYVWGDMGWQLSFSAFAGVMILAPLLQVYFFGNKEPSFVRQILGETIAAHLVTVPIIAMSFGSVSHVAIIANLLIVPLVPLAMLLTFMCGVLVLCSFPFAWLLAAPTTWLLSYMIQVATFVSELPWAQSDLLIAPVLWVVYGLLLIFICYWMWRKTHYNFRDGSAMLG